MDVIKTQQISAKLIEKVIVQPLVLLSIVENYNRVAKDTRKCIVSVLLSSSFKGSVNINNSYVPNPVLVVIDVQPKELGIPTKAYYDVEEMLNKEHEKAEDSKPATAPATSVVSPRRFCHNTFQNLLKLEWEDRGRREECGASCMLHLRCLIGNNFVFFRNMFGDRWPPKTFNVTLLDNIFRCV
ncbi:hypothetical protein QYF36_005503 [Acer negundo]|nr:hypothetical protein QYF36_005503 [Acer negundo]